MVMWYRLFSCPTCARLKVTRSRNALLLLCGHGHDSQIQLYSECGGKAMDIPRIAHSLTTYLLPFLPYLLKAGEQAAEETGKKLAGEACEPPRVCRRLQILRG